MSWHKLLPLTTTLESDNHNMRFWKWNVCTCTFKPAYVCLSVSLSCEERLKWNKIAERKRRLCIKNDPDWCREEKVKRNCRNACKTQARKLKKLPKKEVDAQRKKWRSAKQRYVAKRKAEQAAFAAMAPTPNILRQGTRAESIRRKAKCRAEWNRIRRYWEFEKLNIQVTKLASYASKYKARYYRLKRKLFLKSNSPKSIVNREPRKNREEVSSRIRKQLIFGTAAFTDIGESMAKIRSNLTQKSISEQIRLTHVRKCRLDSMAKWYFPFKSFRSYSSKRRAIGATQKHAKLVKKYAIEFFEDDTVSTYSPSKND